jgi:hypothetical protein
MILKKLTLPKKAYSARIHCSTFNISIPVAGWINRVFTNPESTTYFIPEIVTEVSAMFVDKTNFLTPGGAGAKARIWGENDRTNEESVISSVKRESCTRKTTGGR